MDRYPVDSKNNISLSERRTQDVQHQPHIEEYRMDQKDRAYSHDGTSKSNTDQWSEDDPSIQSEQEEGGGYDPLTVSDEEGYNVAEHTDSPEDDFDDEDRS